MIHAQPSSSPSATSNTSSSPRTPRRPSISNPMSWLSRASSMHTHSPSVGSPATTMCISEPKLVNDNLTTTGGPTYTHSRYGPLGAGATVVRTPQDALARAMLSQTQPYPSHEPPGTTDDDLSSYEGEDDPEPASPGSPPLPPVPFASKSSPNLPVLSEMGELIPIRYHGRGTPSPTRPKPTRPCPTAPAPAARPSPTSSLPMLSTRPLHMAPAPPQPPFTPILLTPVPDVLLDVSSLIVTLDTSTCSLRTTYATLTSRPSHLAYYLQAIARSVHEREQKKFRDTLVEEDEEFFDDQAEDGHDLSSPNTPFASLFAAHLTSAGLLPQSGGMIHLFLDRPSAPYAHILTYLRSPISNATLPRTASLGGRSSQCPERLETLLELRDEAKYLGLEELYRLCCDELRQHQGHVRGSSGGSSSGGSGNHQILIAPERGRNTTLVRLGAIVRREVQQGYPREEVDRDSTGSAGHASARSEVAHVEGVPVSPASSSSAHHARTMSPIVEGSVSRAQSRSRSQGPLGSAWI